MTSTAATPHLTARPYTHPHTTYLLHRLHQEQVTLYGFADDPSDTPASAFLPPNGLFLVACADNVPIACGGWQRRTSLTAEIKRMYVTPEFRGLGLGHRILSHLEDDAAEAGIRHMLLETGRDNAAALRLYIRRGYRFTEPYVAGRDPEINRALQRPLARVSRTSEQTGGI